MFITSLFKIHSGKIREISKEICTNVLICLNWAFIPNSTWQSSVGTKKSLFVPPGREIMEKTPNWLSFETSPKSVQYVPYIASRKRQLIHFKICHLLGKRCSSYSGSVLSDLRNRWPMTWNICEYELTYKISLRPINRRFKWFEETNVNCLTPAQACQHLSGKSKFPSFPLYSIATEDSIIVN